MPSGRQARDAAQALGAESTLDELIVSAWDGLTARRMVVCPVCGSSMSPHVGALGQPIDGRCDDCDCRLS